MLDTHTKHMLYVTVFAHTSLTEKITRITAIPIKYDPWKVLSKLLPLPHCIVDD